MSKKLYGLVSCVIVMAILLCSLCLTTVAVQNAITYTWQGTHAYDAGFAQGTITVSVGASSGGTYYVYWADDSAALSGYDPICKLTIANSGSGSYTMPENTAIPPKATRVLAFKSSSEPTNLSVSAAAMNYTLPIDKATYKTDGDVLYTFASYSDTHITSGEDGAQGQKYPYDEQHLADAFRTAAAHDVDFIVTTGDHVTNHRNDVKGRGNPHYPEEWNTYLRILAESDYDNPIYEAIGNHELWNYDDETDYDGKDWKTGSDYFRYMTGLDSTAATMNTGKAYYEITEPTTGDHFLFMALEGGFYTDRVDEFTNEQLTWLDNKLTAYENDGKNTFILEHANFEKWGAGDRLDRSVYDIPLKETGCASTTALKNILRNHKKAVFLCGHTHFKFDLQLNYSTNNATSATIIHNSSVGGVRDINSSIQRVNDTSRELTEGYIVEVYKDATIFYGTNLYYDRINPSATYIVPQRTSPLAEPTEPAPTQPAPTQPAPTEPTVTAIYGDADDDGDVTILDATCVQRYEAGIPMSRPLNRLNADVDADEDVTIFDATLIQRYNVGVLERFPAERAAKTFNVAEVGVACDVAVVGADTKLEAAGADLGTLRSQAKTALDKYILLASYDQYQALKKAYRRNADYDTLNAAYTAFNGAVSSFYPGDTVDIYFSNNVGWSNVYAYCTAGHGKEKNASWPGKKMTYVTTNSYGEKIYKYTVPTSKYIFVIFNNGSDKQTIDLPLGAVKNQGYYYDSKRGMDGSKYRCSFYTYK